MRSIFGSTLGTLVMFVMVGCGGSYDNHPPGQGPYGPQASCWSAGVYSANCQGIYNYQGQYGSGWQPYQYWSSGGEQYYSPHYSGMQNYNSATSSQGYSAAFAGNNGLWASPYSYDGCQGYGNGYAPVYLRTGIGCYNVGSNPNTWSNYYWYQAESGGDYKSQGSQVASSQKASYGGFDGLLYGCESTSECQSINPGLSCSSQKATSGAQNQGSSGKALGVCVGNGAQGS